MIIVVVQLLSHVQLFVNPWTATHHASLSFTISQSFLKLMSIQLVMPSNHLILCHLLLLPSIFPSIRVFSNESALNKSLLLLLLSRFSRVRLCATPETAAHQAPLPLGFSRQEHWSGFPFPSPMHESEK